MYRTMICTALAAGLTLGLSNAASADEELRFDGVPHRISGPYRHENLALYLVHGPDRLADLALTPIDEALAAGIALVHETGVVGELHPLIAEVVDLRGARLIVAELDISGLGGGRPPDRPVAAPSRHPAVERDLAVVVAEQTPAAAVERAIRGAGADGLAGVRLFDIYRGAPLADDQKSLAWRLVFQSPDRTLTDGEVESAIVAITAALSAIGGRIRT